jgi:hypothetical protein
MSGEPHYPHDLSLTHSHRVFLPLVEGRWLFFFLHETKALFFACTPTLTCAAPGGQEGETGLSCLTTAGEALVRLVSR